jgi:hypothetical protein
MHQCFFNMPIPTLIKIMQNNQLTGFPCMTAKNVKKYLAPSPATPKGRMRRPRTGIRSTGNQKQQREKIKEEPVAASEEETMIRYTGPTEEHVITDDKIANNVFVSQHSRKITQGRVTPTRQEPCQYAPSMATSIITLRMITTPTTSTQDLLRTLQMKLSSRHSMKSSKKWKERSTNPSSTSPTIKRSAHSKHIWNDKIVTGNLWNHQTIG